MSWTKNQEEIQLFRPTWWRFSRYEITREYIRPASGAELQTYDPWEDHRETSKWKDALLPYMSLIELGRALAAPRKLTTADEAKIIAWCNKHGLLGILPHMALTISLGANTERVRGGPPAGQKVRKRFTRTRSGWELSRVLQIGTEETGITYYPTGIPGPRAVLLQDFRSGEINWSSLRNGLSWVFPDVPNDEAEDYAYPMPLSNEFWHQYAEPLDTFLEVVRTFGTALGQIESGDEAGWELLNRWLEPVGVCFEQHDHKARSMRWVSPSLLATYAMMACQDISGPWRIFRCKRDDCRKVFMSSAYQSAYCSSTCRNTVEKRAHRRRKRLKQKSKTAFRKSRSSVKSSRKAPRTKHKSSTARHRL